MRDAVAYFHLATMNHYHMVDWEVLSLFKYARALARVKYLRIGVVGDGEVILPYNDPKIEIKHFGPVGLYEYPTMMWLEEDARSGHDCDMLYFANVGVSHDMNRDDYYPGWRHLCCHYCINEWARCLKELETHDCISIEWQTDPCPHFSGSFWWARSEYIRSLPPLDTDGRKLGHDMVRSPRHGTEFWIGMNPAVRKKSLFQCGMSWRSRPTSVDWYEEAMRREGK